MSKTDTIIEKIILSGEILALSGIHVGGSSTGMSIGGADKSVIRNPMDNRPYLPGSSLKGKMRSLLELSEGVVFSRGGGGVQNGASQDPRFSSVRLFGNAKGDDGQQPSRVIVRDAVLLNDAAEFTATDLPFTEVKTEVSIDRITSKANPRQIERVPAGARFGFSMVLTVHEADDRQKLLGDLLKAMGLLADDTIGGHGSRGYGHISVRITGLVSRTMGYYLGGEAEIDLLTEVSLPQSLQKV